jgi:hypothetical protein
MAERWFSEQELRALARPTMDRAIEALDAGDVQTARELCEAMKHEWGASCTISWSPAWPGC